MPRGVYERPRLSPDSRFFAKVEQSGDCWRWTAYLNRQGYGWFNVDGNQSALAHRWAYEHMVAEIPEGLTLDHLCANPACVNPYHMDPVPLAVNVSRAAARNHFRLRERCSKGHRYTEETTQVAPNGARRCRICVRARSNAYTAKLGRQECPWCGEVVTGSVLRRHARLKHDMDVTAADIRAARQQKV